MNISTTLRERGSYWLVLLTIFCTSKTTFASDGTYEDEGQVLSDEEVLGDPTPGGDLSSAIKNELEENDQKQSEIPRDQWDQEKNKDKNRPQEVNNPGKKGGEPKGKSPPPPPPPPPPLPEPPGGTDKDELRKKNNVFFGVAAVGSIVLLIAFKKGVISPPKERS